MSVKEITTGQDSFLDIVANLVGILIILVVVVGAQASASWVKPKPKIEQVDAIAQLESEISKTSNVMEKFRIDNEQLESKIVEESRFAARLTDQRHQMYMQLKIVKDQIEKEREKLASKAELIDKKASELVKKQSAFLETKNKLERELKSIQREAGAVAATQEPKSEVINHFPNPIAKTVFSEEVHFRLAEGKLAYVPMEELIERMKGEWKVKAEKLSQSSRTVETVGPIANFRMQYELAAENVTRDTKSGRVRKRSVQFQRFQLLPSGLSLGEPLEVAFQPGSDFLQVLSRMEPRKTTISVWVYPDCFDEHEQLKNWIHENGFQMASWPLDFGKRISGGPNGFKTSAQ